MFELSGWPLWALWSLFAGAALAIAVSGTLLTGVADQLADRTGLGEAIFGAVFIGATTSLPGITVSFVAGLNGQPELAASNAVGGIIAQTAFLGIADLAYRRSNLEHAAASSQNIIQAVLLIALLGLVVVGIASPEVVWWRVHPVTILLTAAYISGLWLVKGDGEKPMWHPRLTKNTKRDEPDERSDTSTLRLWVQFGLYVPVLLAAGVAIERSASALAAQLGIQPDVTGALLTAIPTSLPELVIAVAAVRRGALTLAVGDIIGGNSFDTLFLAAADIGYGGGSIYHDAGDGLVLLTGVAIVLSAVLVLGFVRREESGIANIGFETVIVLAGTAALYLMLLLG